MNVQVWILMIFVGFNVAISARVSNELGANSPTAAKFSIIVAVITSTMFGVVFSTAIVATKNCFPNVFSSIEEVKKETSKSAYFLAASILLNSIQSILNGVAVGAGWQVSVAMINIGCYYAVGIPMGALLGYKLDLGVKGIWLGMLAGSFMQIAILSVYVLRSNWIKEALYAEERVRSHGTSTLPQNGCVENELITNNQDR